MYSVYYDTRKLTRKLFDSYEEARKYVRRYITQFYGGYRDSFSDLGFTILKVK